MLAAKSASLLCGQFLDQLKQLLSHVFQAPKQPPAGTLPFQKGLVTTPDDLAAAESKQKWPLSLAARPAMWEGLDTQGLSATSSRGATSRRVQGHLGLRRLPGQPLGPFERDKLLDSFNQFRQNGGHLPSMASSTSHFSRGVDLLDVQSHDMEALQQRCAELEALVTELKRHDVIRFKKHQQKMFAKKALSRWRLWCIVLTGKAQDNSAALDFLSDAADCRYLQQSLQLHLLGWPKQRMVPMRRWPPPLRASAACLAAVEAAQDATEARRRVEEELAKEAAAAKRASSNELAEAAAARAAVQEASRAQELARSRASAMQKLRGDSHELAMLASCFATWRLWLADSRINCARDAMEEPCWEHFRHDSKLDGRSECDVLLLQAEARHRIALQKLRSELAEAQAKQKEASAAERLALQDGQGPDVHPKSDKFLKQLPWKIKVANGRWCQPACLMDEVSLSVPALQLQTRFKRLLTTSYSSALISGAIAGSTTEVILLVCSETSMSHIFTAERSPLAKEIPSPGRGEVLVRVYASNINPVDHKIVELAGWSWTYPHKLGYDVAGVVQSVGVGCTRLKVGDRVWGEATSLMEAPTTAGTYAQYAVVSESILGVKPESISMLEAGAMPMVALTGLESLTWAAGGSQFGKNATVLVLGGRDLERTELK
eukprot:g21562.t1